MTVKGKIRIIGGHYRGRKITVVHEKIRPTSDRVRETLFNWLHPKLVNKSCLDLFAGTGILGIEALSRGARKVVFVDHQQDIVSEIKNQTTKLQLNNASVILSDSFNYLEKHWLLEKEPKEIGYLQFEAKHRYQQFLEDFHDIISRIPQYHIASFLGITPTQLSRIRKELN